jgi:hypothetical protein
MLCIRIELRGSFVGLVHDSDRAMIRSLVKRFGAGALALVPVVVL